MGAASSALNCGSKKDKDKKRKKDKNSNQTLSNDIEKYQDNVDALRNSGGEVERRVSQRDKDLVEDRLKNREKRYNDVKARTEKIQKGFEVLELDLEEIQGKVDQYLSWLKKKEEQALLTLPQGYDVGEAEEKVQYLNNLCMDLENRQFTLDTVNKKVETILPDLSARDREEMEQSLHALGTEHQRVYEVAIAQKNLLAESLNTREVFQVGLERVALWLQDREAGIANLEKLRLTAADVEKQAEKAKALQTEVEKYEPNISQVESRIQVLLPECQAETSAELQQKLQDVQTRYADLKTHLKDVYDKIRTNASARKVYETDLQKVDRWCKETDMKCAIEPALDCATEVLQQQYKQYKTLDNTAEMFNSLMKEVQERADTFQPQLNEADAMTLQQQTKTTHDKLDRISKLIKDRLKSLEEALQSRDQLGEGIQEATDWLESVQVDLRKIPRSIGPTVNEAEEVLKKYEDVAEKIANYQPTVAQLNQAVERLRHLGQNSEAEEVLRITSQYETLNDQVKQQTKKCQQAMSSRQQLEDKMKEMDGVIKECEDSADSVIGLAVPIPEKIEKLQAVSTKLHSAAPVLFTMGDRAQQIGIEGTPNDAIAVSSMVEDVRARVDNLKKIADRKIRQCESIQKNREDFQGTVDETINWLESKEDILASCGSLDLDPVKVKSTLQKHQALSRDALDKLDTVKMKATMEQTHYQDMEEPVPDQLTEKLEQINTLEDSIKEAISKKEQYLTEATADRMQLEVSMKQIHEWIHGAEDMLDSGYEGLDYDTLNDTISEHKDYFSEASMCQDEMDQVMELSERLLPTLDMNDTETLRESLKNTSQKLADVMAASQRKQQVMMKKCEEWNEYQEMVMKVNGDLQILETEWEELDSVQLNSPTQIQKHLTDTKEFIDKVETFRPVINELNERSHDLDREAAQKSQQLINELMTNVNSRWKDLVGQTENKQMILQDLEAQYEDYSQLLHAVDLALDEAESKIPATVDLDNVKCPDLVAQLNQTQDLMETIETAEPKITALKKCAHQLQKGLPTAEAKVQSQDIVMAMLEKYERIADRAKESKQMLQEEIDDREGFNTEAVQTVDWLTETKTELQQLGATMEVPEVMEKIEKLKLSEQEIAIRMEQMRHMAQLQETKYKSQGREVPRELRDQIENMVILEKEVTTTMKTKEEELLHLKADRQNYSTELKVITTWLAQAREQLQDRVMDIPEAIYRHEELLGEFDPFKKKLDNLRNQGGDLIKHTSDPVEKTSVQKQLADANKQWLSLQAQAAEKTRQLQQAEALARDFTQTVEALEGWAEQAEATLVAEPAWTDFERVKEQLKQHRRLLKDSDQQQNKLGHLNTIVKQMEPLCDVVPQMEKFADLSHRSFDIRARTSDKVNDLEEIAEQIEDYEIELADLKHWMDKTRAHLTMRDDTLTLSDQLRMQENLISDIESHKGKALFVLQKHAELHAAIGEDSPLHNTKLAAEINTLLQQAHEDCDELREAVAQQDQYESEMRQLTKSIKEAQEQLLGSPIQASSVETLKQQISEHNDLSRSVPSLLDPHLQGLRDRSSSFGSKLGPGPRSLQGSRSASRSSKFDDLNSSWQNLQRQLGTKERELQLAIQKQERYQSAVQDVTARMELVQQKLLGVNFNPYKDMDRQMKDHRDAENEISSLREDIARVRERGRQIMETSDPEGYQAMQATLTMLSDKIENLQNMADDKAKQLQTAMKDREKHKIALVAYKKHVKEIEDWYDEMKVRQSTTPQPTDGVTELQQQLLENKELQDQLNQYLQQVADLAIQCDSICEMEPPADADKLRSQLSTLQQNLGNLKLSAIEKQAPLRTAIKDSEKRKREMDDYESNVKHLQKWISDTKKLAAAPPAVEQMVTPVEKHQLQQQLQSDLFQHRNLVRQLSTEMRSRERESRPVHARMVQIVPVKEEDVQPRWEKLSKEMAEKKENLEELIRNTSELIGPGKYGRRHYGPDTSSQLQDIRRHLGALTDLWKQLQVQVDDKQLRLEQALEFQQKYQDALQNVSGWLDLAEQKLFAPDANLNSEEKVKENEDIQREIKSLQGEILAMGHAAQELLAVANADSHDLIRHSLANLNDRVQILEGQAKEQGDKLRTIDRQYKQYQDEVRNLEGKMSETRDLMASPGASAPLNQRVASMQIKLLPKIEAQLKKCESQMEDVKKRQSELSALDPEIISPHEMDSLQSNYMDLQRKVMEKKASLQQSVSVQEQYEKLLQDYADFLETADEKLKVEAISARDLDHLKQQLNAHKDFFCDLEVHRAMLDSLVAQCDKATKQKHLPSHTRLSNLTYVLQDKASLRGQRLDRLVRQWGEMDEKFSQLQRFLDDIEVQMPKPITNDDALPAIQGKIDTYNRLQRELNDEKPTVFQVVDRGKQLLHSINCPTLETLIKDLADKWVNLNTDLSHQVKQSQSLGDQLQVFEAEAAVLKSWLSAARSKLTSIKQLSSTDLRSIAIVRNKIDKILEFRKEVENQLPLKDKVLSVGKQLLQNQVYQTADLDERLKHLELEWAHLEHDITNSEEYLHQAQMDLMPSRQALGELNAWLTEIEETLQEEKTKPMKSMADIEVLLKKYKSYKIDLSSKQLTVDFVNQDVLKPSEDSETPLPAEINEFSERLGTLNSRWEVVSRHVSDRLASLEGVHGKWEEFEKSLARLIGWFREQEDKIKKYHLIGHEVSVRQTLKDCKALKQTLRNKQHEMDQLKELGETLTELSQDAPGIKNLIHSNLESVKEHKRSLESQLNKVDKLLEDVLAQWDSYHSELQVVSQTLAETEYCLQRYNLIGGDIATLKIQVEKLESLLHDMDKNTPHFEKFVALATRLSQVCEAPTRQEIQRTQADIQTRWQKMHGELRSHTEKFRDCLQQWLMYEEEYVRARTWLDVKENLCDDLLYGKEPRDNNLTNCQSLQQDLDNFQTQLSNLYRVGDDVTKNMDPSAIVNITSKLSGLEQRLLTLRQKIAKHIQSLQGDMSQHKRFQEAFDNVKAFISQAQRILGMDDPNKSADEKVLSDRLEYLKELLSQFSDNSAQLDSLNDLGYRLALNETAAADLQDLNHFWHDLFSETKERTKTLQGILLVQQDFTEKCDTWMAFLAQTEADLSTEIAGNLVDLCIQQRKCEKFESEMYSRQQILHAIISDGQTMMNNGDVEDREAFQQKLHLLAAQWQSVTRRANQRKAIIDTTIKQWQAFNDSSEKLREWLADKEEGLQVFNFDTASLQKVKNLVEKAKQTQNEFKLQEDMFKSMNTQGNQLLLRADDTAQEELRVSMAQVQQHWHQIYVNLDGEREKLEGVLKQWRECEEDIEDILTWLKDTRKALSGGLPTAYEDLQADMHRCKDIESAFVHNEPKRQTLLTKERDLSKVIEPEDLNVLHQRIRLMNKQWEELRNQANLRGQRIDDTMFRWSNFSEKVKDLCDWIDKMEVKVISSKDYHIEDLLNRMQKDFKDEMMDKERSKNNLVDQGHQLIKVSSEVRASDIEQKITRMEDKWEHLRAVIGFRERKLQETLLAVQQLDVSMSNLRKWLADMENDLAAPVVYVECSRKEIQKKLQHQNDLQHDIERHSPGVGSVLNLCEVLLHDSDACPTEVEFNGLQTAMKNLERRWRNICQMSPEQRTKIEETWTLWQTLMDDCRVFGDWLKVMEAEITDASPDQSNVSVTKEEFRRCEIAQRKIHENLSNLENINKQYRRLAREGRTDSTGTLKTMMQDANDRWDMLQGQMSAILRQLKHSSSIREDFKKTKESLLSWLTEIDMQLTNIDHLSSMDVHTKLREMDRIREEVANRDKKFAYLDEAGLYLIQKGDSADAIAVQAELDTFRQYYRQVMEKLTLTKVKLEAEEDLEKRQDEDELDQLERELYSLAPGETLDWDMREIEAYLESSPPDSPPEKRRALLRKIRESSRSRSTSPIKKLPSVTAATSSPIIGSSPTRKFTSTPRRLRSKSPVHRSTSPVRSTSPLRSTSPIRSSSSPRTGTPRSGTPRSQTPTRSRSPTRLSTLRAKSPMTVAQDYVDSRARSPTRQETYNRLRTELGQKGKATNVDDILEKLADALEHADMKLTVAERELRCHTPTGPGLEQQSADYLQSMSDAEKAVDDVRRIERLLKAETGLRVIASSDAEVRGIIQRWEMLQAGAIKKDYRLSQHKQEWSQFKADLENMMSWLDEAEALQRTHKPLPGEITKLDTIIRQHKDLNGKDFLVQLDAKKSRVISLNLTSKEIMDLHTEEGRDLRDRLRLMNKRWDAICGQATRLQQELQVALMHCQEFHHTIHDLLLWLENIETKIQQCEPINLGNDEAALWSRLRKLQDIKFDLEKNQPRVMSLRDTADQLLINSDSPEMSNAKDKMHIIANRLKALHRLCSSYVTSLETRLDTKPASAHGSSAELNMSLGSAESDSPRGGRTSTPTHISRRYPFRPTSSSSSTFRPRTRSPFALTRELFAGIPRPWISRSLAGRGLTADTLTEQHEEELAERHCLAFCCRVLRAAIPLQLLILLLLGLAALVPMSEDDYSCMLANNFRRSLEQMLQYTDGPPPV